MREIKFQGKRIDNGEWVEGFYHFTNWHDPKTLQIVETIHSILPIGGQDAYRVDPDTVGQFTGLKDTKRTEQYPEGQGVYEGDICRITQACDEEIIGEVVWDEDYLRYALDIGHDLWDFANIIDCEHVVEVIGNIYDNPEILEG